MPGFNSAGNGDLTSGLFLTETDILDDLVGDSLFSLGYNFYGTLGDNTTSNKSFPTQTVAGGTNWKQVACGQLSTTALKTDGTLWSWGYNFYGQLGNGTTVDKSSPVQTVAGGTNWKQVAHGTYYASAIKTDGTLWGWGYNGSGGLGDNTTADRSSPVQTITGGNNWKQVSCSTGGYHTAAIKTDGTLWLWGYNQLGQLGEGSNNPTLVNRSSPVQTIAGGTNWKQVSLGKDFTAAIKTDGTLWTWGKNNNGELGDGTSGGGANNKSSPIQTVAGGTNWKQVSCGAFHASAIKTDGTLWGWGDNNPYGQLGDGTSTDRSSPVQTVAGGNNWKQVACGYYTNAAIKTDGTLWAWGLNSYGELGDGTTTRRSSPVQTTAGGNNWKQVSVGANVTAAITTGQVT